MSSPKFNALLRTLRQLFLFDRADLDFGLYRIMNARRAEIEDFLENRLLPSVRTHLGAVKADELKELEKQVEETIQMTMEYGGRSREEAEKSDKVIAAKQALHQASDLSALEDQVFSLLVTFFSRYYDEGDFITKRRYSGPGRERYMIPYDGEEVKLVWANMDQYYIKSGENFSNYTFKLEDGKRVHFRVKTADTEKDNRKGDEKRSFFIHSESPAEIDGDGDLVIYFAYREATKEDGLSAQEEKALKERFGAKNKGDLPNLRNAAAALDAVEALGEAAREFLAGLSEVAPTENVPQRPLIAKQIHRYVAGNTYDFFIHKDLHGFLTRELDYFLKSEVLEIEDMIDAPEERVRQSLRKTKAVREIAGKLIQFLANLEDFQKKLWLKKKFVTECHYCFTLDRVIEHAPELLPEIAASERQQAEWKNIYGIEEEITADGLKDEPFMMVDTGFFDERFKLQLLAKIPYVDAQCDGVLINGENSQSMRVLHEKYQDSVDSIYIDPPYNAAATEILYKNSFKHSSWCALIDDRISIGTKLLRTDGALCVTIDDYEIYRLKQLLDQILGEDNYLSTVPIRNNPSGRSTVSGFAICHEYALFYAKKYSDVIVGRLPHSDEQRSRYDQIDKDGKPFEWENFRKSSAGSNRSDRPKQFFPIYFLESGNVLRIPEANWDDETESWTVIEQPKPGEIVILPIDSSNRERVWNFGYSRTVDEIADMKVEKREDRLEVYKKKFLKTSGTLPRTWWDKSSYSARDNGTRRLKSMFRDNLDFDFPKAVEAVADSLRILSPKDDAVCLDYFAGSGTTADAVIFLNRTDRGSRKYLLAEMGFHFERVLKPRIIKAIYSADWRAGQPQDKSSGISHCFKYLRLESYEDALNNLEAKRTEAQQDALDKDQNLKDEYLLGYFLEPETKDSASLLKLEAFKDPWAYKLMISTTSVGEMKEQTVDLVETFNYLIGLQLEQISTLQTVRPDKTPERDPDGQLQVKNFRKAEYGEPGTWTFQVVSGTTRAGEKTLILWRTLSEDRETDNAVLDAFLNKQDESPTRQDWDVLYVNGDSNLQNLEISTEDTETEGEATEARVFKVRMIEQEFKTRMFADTE